MPPPVVVSTHPGLPVYQDTDEEPLPLAPAAPAAPVQPTLSPPEPPELTTVPSDDEQSSSLASADTMLDVPFHIPSPASSLRSRATMLLLLTNHRVPLHVHLRNLLAQDLKDSADLLHT